jgi:hypothetical protein
MQDVREKLNLVLSLQKVHSEIRKFLDSKLGLFFGEKKLTSAFAASDFYGGENCII